MINLTESERQSILLVEDNADDYEATIRAFKKTNMLSPVVWCQSGQDALDFLNRTGQHSNHPDEQLPGMVLLDLNMPGMDGRKTLRLIKENPYLRQIPIVILTTSADERDVNACYQMGANTYIQKPISFDGLLEAVMRLKEYWFEIALLPRESGQA